MNILAGQLQYTCTNKWGGMFYVLKKFQTYNGTRCIR
jgi:hypothetical protein